MASVLALAAAYSSDEFGLFATVYAVMTLALGVTRAYLGLPIALGASLSRVEQGVLYGSSVAAAIYIAAVAASGVLVLGIATSTSATGVSIVVLMSVAVPILLVQDLARFHAVATRRTGVAVASDSLWLMGALILWVSGSSLSPVTATLLWILIAAGSMVVAVGCLTPSVDWSGGWRTLRPGRGAREASVAQVAMSGGVTVVTALVVAPVYGAGAVGALRGAGTVLGPLNTLMTFLDFGVLAALARRSRSKDVRALVLVMLVLLGALVLWALILLMPSSPVGRAMFADSWPMVRDILPITCVEYGFLLFIATAGIFFKLRDQGRQIVVAKILSVVVVLIGVGCAAVSGLTFIAIPLVLAGRGSSQPYTFWYESFIKWRGISRGSRIAKLVELRSDGRA